MFYIDCFPLIVSFIRSDSWQLVQSECLPSSVNNVGCSPFQFHESTIYSPVNSSSWTRVTVQLPDHVSSGYLSIKPRDMFLYALMFQQNKSFGMFSGLQRYSVPLDSEGGDRREAQLGGGSCLHWRDVPRALQQPWVLHEWGCLHL